MTTVRTRAELLTQGIPAGTIDSRTRSGQYTRILPRTYILGEPTTFTRCLAVTRWQDCAVISHRSAAWLYGWAEEPPVVEATVPRHIRRRTPAWLKLYRRDLDLRHCDEVLSVPTVGRAQAVTDCIAVMSEEAVGRIVDESVRLAVEPDSLLSNRIQNPRRRGNKHVLRQLHLCAFDAASEPERLLARALNARNFRLPANVRIGPYVVDFVDERAKLVVEVDGREFHSEPEVFRTDRHRQNWLVRQGWMVLRYAAFDVLLDPAKVADEVISVARRRRAARR